MSVVVRTEVNVTYHTPSFSWGKKNLQTEKKNGRMQGRDRLEGAGRYGRTDEIV